MQGVTIKTLVGGAGGGGVKRLSYINVHAVLLKKCDVACSGNGVVNYATQCWVQIQHPLMHLGVR
jgi:hypothetical protein